MAKSVKAFRAALKGRTVVGLLLACGLAMAAGLGNLWLQKRNFQLGQDMKKLEQQVDALKREHGTLLRTYAAISSPRELDGRARSMNLGLAAPQPEQLVRIREKSGVAPSSGPRKLLTAHGPVAKSGK